MDFTAYFSFGVISVSLSAKLCFQTGFLLYTPFVKQTDSTVPKLCICALVCPTFFLHTVLQKTHTI